MPRLSAPVWLLAVLATGCFSSPGGEATKPIPTLVAVAPQDFLGDVPCTDAPGGLRTYVARLFDHGTAEEPVSFELPAAVVPQNGEYRPVPCTQVAVFGHVVPTHKYSAIVEAYDRADLKALAPGSPVLIDGVGKFVEARWKWRCGRDEAGNPTTGAVVSAHSNTRFVRGCVPIDTGAPPTETGISVDVTAISGAPGCGSGIDQIERFRVRRKGSPDPLQEAACGELVTFAPLEPGGQYQFELLAYEGGQTVPRWGATCFRIALDGVIAPATCGALSETGSLEIDFEALLSAANLSCGTTEPVKSLTATLGESSESGCSSASFEGFAPGSYSVAVKSEPAGYAATCSGEILPGWVTQASCSALALNP